MTALKKTEEASKGKEARADNPRILVVDDDVMMLKLMKRHLEDLGYETVLMEDGTKVYDYVEANHWWIDVILLDRKMPNISGIEIVTKIKDTPTLKNIPIVMQTSSKSPEEVQEGIEAGVFYYLTKPVDVKVLRSVISSAVREAQQNTALDKELEKHKASFNSMVKGQFEFRSIEEADGLACFLANCFPEPDRVVSGLAEIMTNAVEHGNLDIGYEEKTQLIEEGVWKEAIQRRLDLPENENKKVVVNFWKNEEGIFVRVKDQGKGFDWRSFLVIDPSRASDNHGRGIAQANMICFDGLSYNDAGNEVTIFVNNEAPLDW